MVRFDRSWNKTSPEADTLATRSSYQKSNLHYIRSSTPKHVTSGGANLRGLAPEQHSSKETPGSFEPVATLCTTHRPGIRSPRPLAPVAMSWQLS